MSRTRILIADDQVDVREALGEVISGDSSLDLIGVAEDADQAIELARLHRPHVALLDVKMPAGGGPRAAHEIGQCSPETRVVVLSAYEDRGSVFQMLQAGAVGYLVKGATIEEIRGAISRAVSGESVLGAEVTGDVVSEALERVREQARSEEEWSTRVARIHAAARPGGLRTVFQPIVELEQDKPVGYEALTRFLIPSEPPPEELFREASEVGLRTELEVAALRSATAHVKDLPRGAFLAVNVSPGVLAEPAVLEELASIPPKRLVVEMTEHTPVDDYDRIRSVLRDLRARGARLAVDDAGAGFASLRHVLQLAPDIVKIDGSVVRELEPDQGARALTAALVAFAREMGETVIAEGIESERTLYVLKALGVLYGQGNVLGQPGDLPSPGRKPPASSTRP